MQPTDHVSAYVLVRVYSPEEKDVVALVTNDDWLRFWCNGELVLAQPLCFETPAPLAVHLRAGGTPSWPRSRTGRTLSLSGSSSQQRTRRSPAPSGPISTSRAGTTGQIPPRAAPGDLSRAPVHLAGSEGPRQRGRASGGGLPGRRGVAAQGRTALALPGPMARLAGAVGRGAVGVRTVSRDPGEPPGCAFRARRHLAADEGRCGLPRRGRHLGRAVRLARIAVRRLRAGADRGDGTRNASTTPGGWCAGPSRSSPPTRKPAGRGTRWAWPISAPGNMSRPSGNSSGRRMTTPTGMGGGRSSTGWGWPWRTITWAARPRRSAPSTRRGLARSEGWRVRRQDDPRHAADGGPRLDRGPDPPPRGRVLAGQPAARGRRAGRPDRECRRELSGCRSAWSSCAHHAAETRPGPVPAPGPVPDQVARGRWQDRARRVRPAAGDRLHRRQ